MFTKAFAAAMLGSLAQAADETKCRGLAMSGGANHGAWEVGVLWGLNHYGDPADFAWNVVTGVSAGAINTAAVAMFDKDDGLAMSEFLSDAWVNLKSDEIWEMWDVEDPKDLLTVEASLLDSDPAIVFMQDLLKDFPEFGRKFTISAVDLDSGGYINFDQDNLARNEIEHAAMASGSIPGIFQPRELHGYHLVDGGTAWNINIDSAITQCLALGYKPEDIIVDVMMCSNVQYGGYTISNNAMENWMNGFEIHKSYNDMNAY